MIFCGLGEFFEGSSELVPGPAPSRARALPPSPPSVSPPIFPSRSLIPAWPGLCGEPGLIASYRSLGLELIRQMKRTETFRHGRRDVMYLYIARNK